MRLIDADTFDKMLAEEQEKCGSDFRYGVLADIRADLALFPTVNRSEILQCKDCRRYYANGGSCDQVLSDWFCADVKRR